MKKLQKNMIKQLVYAAFTLVLLIGFIQASSATLNVKTATETINEAEPIVNTKTKIVREEITPTKQKEKSTPKQMPQEPKIIRGEIEEIAQPKTVNDDLPKTQETQPLQEINDRKPKSIMFDAAGTIKNENIPHTAHLQLIGTEENVKGVLTIDQTNRYKTTGRIKEKTLSAQLTDKRGLAAGTLTAHLQNSNEISGTLTLNEQQFTLDLDTQQETYGTDTKQTQKESIKITPMQFEKEKFLGIFSLPWSKNIGLVIEIEYNNKKEQRTIAPLETLFVGNTNEYVIELITPLTDSLQNAEFKITYLQS